ncbi:helix-turn-helix domain-containing protein [Kitasatospora sp. NPDC088556]|uniref:helix-turn-helix domain-containing protein n=1 Tax=Kitasatospora sp. NPDC088556 TaxID=3364076 RepID=UPI003816784F
MPTLGSLPTDMPELRLTFVWGDPKRVGAKEVAGVVTMAPEQLLNDGVPGNLPDSSLVLITSAVPFRLRGRITTVLETLLQHMSRKGSPGLIVSAVPGARQPFPQPVMDQAKRLDVPLLTTTAPAERWEGVHDEIQQFRLRLAERRASQLSSLVQELPAQLADSRAMQRIADWLARVLDVQVLVSEPERVLAASPATAAEQLAQAIIQQSIDAGLPDAPSRPHTQLIPLVPTSGVDTVLAVARRIPFDEADLRLLRHAAKLLGLVDQAHREYRAASDASRAARSAAFELLLDGEVAKARRVMTSMVPGLLEPDTARVFVVETEQAHRDAAVRRCSAAIGHHALVVPDSRRARRIIIVHPIRSEEDNGAAVSAELTYLVGAFGTHSSLGGSGVYSMTLLADALHEAITAQSFAALQPDPVALSVHESDLVGLLPQAEAQHWARHLLSPLMRDGAQWESMRETLPAALAYPYTVAARRLHLHRNTVMRRAARAAELLDMNFGRVGDRIIVALALEMVTQRETAVPAALTGAEPPALKGLLAAPQVQAWAQTLVRPVQADRRDLLTTARAWLAFDTHVEPASRALGLSEVTVRSHLRALENHMQRDLATLSGVRDLHVSLHVATGNPGLLADHPDDGLCIMA